MSATSEGKPLIPSRKIAGLCNSTHFRRFGEFAWPSAIFLLAAAVFFRTFLRSGFDVVMGESVDARFDIFIREHLLRALSGAAQLTSPPMFFPVRDTLGYSDAYLLDALIYIPARLLGADPFLSFQLTLIALSLVGFASFNILLTRHADVRQPIAAVAAAVFTFSNALYISVGHPQLLEVNFCPLITVLMLQASRDAAEAPVRAIVAGFAAGAILGLLFSTGYYVAWYYLLAAAVTVVVYGILKNRLVLHGHVATIRRNLRVAVATGIGFALGLVPFCVIYLPVLATLPGRSFDEYLFYAPSARDLINVGPHNRMWGHVLGALNILPDDHLNNSEVVLAITPVLLTAYLASVAAVLSGRVLADAKHRALRNAFIASFVAFAVIVVTMVKFDEHSLFLLLWDVVPGARAIRAGGRAQIVLNGIAAAGSAIVLMRFLQQTRARHIKAMLWLLPLLVLVEQFNDIDNTRLSRTAEMAFTATPLAPAACKSFFLAPHSAQDAQRSGQDAARQIDAMLIAQKVGVPTLNGYSGLSPPGWRMEKIDGDNYLRSAWTWAKRHSIEAGLCQYDYAARQWQAFDGADPYAVHPDTPIMFHRGGDGESVEGEGWANPERSGTWTNAREADLLFKVSDWDKSPIAVEVAARPFLVEDRHPAIEVEVLANGVPIGTWKYDIAHDRGLVKRLAIIPESVMAQSSFLKLTFRINTPLAPSDAGTSTDTRSLGILVSRISFFKVQDNSVVRETPRITPGSTVSFGDEGDDEPFEKSGWSAREQFGTWTVGPRATFSASISGWPDQDMVIAVTARPYLVKGRHGQLDVALMANDVAVDHWIYREGQDRGLVIRSARIPASVLKKSPVLHLELDIDAPSSPAAFESNSGDTRPLGLMVARMRFDRAEN